MADYKIIESHAHFFADNNNFTEVKNKYVKEFGEEKWNYLQSLQDSTRERWRKTYDFPNPDPINGTIEEIAQQWIEDMDKKNVEKVIFATAGTFDNSDENMKRIIKYAPSRFVGYSYFNPFDKDAPQKLEKAIQDGLSGLKILAPEIEKSLDDKCLYPLWEVCEKYEIPVLIHFGILGGAGGVAKHVNMSPMIIHDVVKGFPRIPFIIPHFGCGQTEDLLMLCWVSGNVYVDTSGSNQWVKWMPYPLTIKDLYKKFYETIGEDRIIFGADSMWFPRGFVKSYYNEQKKACYELGFSEETIEKIFRKNILKILNNVKV